MENKELIGKKVKGFKFETEIEDLKLDSEIMDFFTGKIGIIKFYNPENDSYNILFEDYYVSDTWCYPAELIEQHIVEANEMIPPSHYDNSNGSLYQFAENHNLNAYEFDIIKRIVRCRKKGNFIEDLEKTKVVIDLYLKEFKN